jgi:hypothetical protein
MNGLLRNVCLIERRPDPSVQLIGSSGDVLPAYEVVASDVPCRVEPRSGDYRQQEYGTTQAVTHRIFLGSKANVQVGDRVVLGDTRFLVTFIADQFGHHFEADASLVIGS